METTKYVFVWGDNRIEMRDGNPQLPYGSVSEIADALAVFKITASDDGIKIDTIKVREGITFNGVTHEG